MTNGVIFLIIINMRYSRLEALSEIGREGVEKINRGKVFVIGCGALGSLCAMYLAASGVGTVGIADFDTIDLSNLQRQLFFSEDTLGQFKSQILANRIKSINTNINVEEYAQLINKEKAERLFPNYDFIIDGSDNPATKMMTSSVCEKLKIPYCIGGVREFGGQVMSWREGKLGYKEIFGEVESCNDVLPCSLSGVMGPVAGVVASIQAAEAIKHLTGTGQMLYDKLYTIDLLNLSTNVLECVP